MSCFFLRLLEPAFSVFLHSHWSSYAEHQNFEWSFVCWYFHSRSLSSLFVLMFDLKLFAPYWISLLTSNGKIDFMVFQRNSVLQTVWVISAITSLIRTGVWSLCHFDIWQSRQINISQLHQYLSFSSGCSLQCLSCTGFSVMGTIWCFFNGGGRWTSLEHFTQKLSLQSWHQDVAVVVAQVQHFGRAMRKQ